jgi:hypothetical protein
VLSQYDSGERCGPWASCLLVKITLELEIICSRLFSLDLVNIDTKLLLSDDNALPVQTNINNIYITFLQLFINSSMKLVDLPTNYCTCYLLFNIYHEISWLMFVRNYLIFGMAYCLGDGLVSCQNFFPILLSISIKYVQNNCNFQKCSMLCKME